MNLIKLCIARPVGVTVGVLLVVMFGLLGLREIPIQLTPTIDLPLITVTTNWPGRSPEEVVDEITKEQEERLKNVTNLQTMRSLTSEGTSTITLEFTLGSDMTRSLQEVSDALRQVPEYPDEVDEPVPKIAGSGPEKAITWIILDVDPAAKHLIPDFDVETLFDRIDREVKPYLERIDGVAEVNIYGGRASELHVLLDPRALADRSLSHFDVIQALQRENRNVSAGTINEGKREIRVRVVGQFQSPADAEKVVVAYRDGKPVYVHDLGSVTLGHEKARGFVRSFGQPCLAINCIRQANSNVVEIMKGVRARLEEIRTDLLPTLDPVAGPHLRLVQVYDETTYIDSAVALVTDNLWLGGLLAAFVLILFLRSFVSTGIISLAIPISVIATFLVLFALGRTLNVVSLAGLAFATGMVVDNGIVVLENIYRRLQEGDPPLRAAYKGTMEVWGAVLASTATTVAVFIPVLTIQEEAGQLFRDIALAMAISVSLSLIISITVVPAAASRWLRRHDVASQPAWRRGFENLFGIVSALAAVNAAIAAFVRWCMKSWRGWSIRPALILGMTAASLYLSSILMPPMDYLPKGNRNLVFGAMLIPPGYSIPQREGIAQRVETPIKPYALASLDDPSSLAALPPINRMPGLAPFKPVAIDNFFIGAFGSILFVGATSENEQIVLPLSDLLSSAMNNIPDAMGFASQSSIFGEGVGGGATINVEISGPSLDRVRAAAGVIQGMCFGQPDHIAFAQAEPTNYNLRQHEWQVRLNDAGREMGLRTLDVGLAVRALFDGAFAGDYINEGDTIDILVLPEGGELEYKEKLADISIATPAGRVVPLSSVVDVIPALASQEILRIEELPSVSLAVSPKEGVPVGEVMEVLQNAVIAPVRAMGMIDSTMTVSLEGTAAQLDEVAHAMLGNPAEANAPWPLRTPLVIAAIACAGVALLLTVLAAVKAIARAKPTMLYGAAGFLCAGLLLAGLLYAAATQPQLGTARFVWALAVTYLLMAALFESLVSPLVIMFSVPLAIVGGFAGLNLVHRWTLSIPTQPVQNFDVLTMLGFVVLVGVVVNNAILLVHQSLNFMKGEEGSPMEPHEAIVKSVRTRIRPIMMTVCTSLGGMLPLVLFPGAGAEMYRGLGAVMLGGLLCSTVFTIILVPLLFSLTIDMGAGMREALGLKPRSPAESFLALERSLRAVDDVAPNSIART